MEEFKTTTENDELLKELGLLTDGEPLKKRKVHKGADLYVMN